MVKPDPVQLDTVGRAEMLVGLFCSPEEFGRMRGVTPPEVPEPDRSLLDHESHMTVAMERFHGGAVRLRVVASRAAGAGHQLPETWYAREILLENQAGTIVQYGIVRLDLTSLDDATVREILEEKRPLGRVLIEAGVLRDVRHVALLELSPGTHLTDLLWPAGRASGGGLLYGRVASIQLNGRPAVELLEIVVPG